jgi:hypothetical protein
MTSSWPGSAIERLPEGRIRFSLTESEINWIRIDYQCRIQFGAAELVIETRFELTAVGRSYQLDPNDRGGLGPFAALYPDTAADILMSPDGELGMTFASGTRLVVPPHPRFEAWSLGGFVCVPGGFEP